MSENRLEERIKWWEERHPSEAAFRKVLELLPMPAATPAFLGEMMNVQRACNRNLGNSGERVPSQLLQFAQSIAKTDEEIAGGYKVKYVTTIRVEKDNYPIYGPFIEIRDREGGKVGFLGISFGYPISIDCIQGYKGALPKKFHAVTKTPFEIALIDLLAKKINKANLDFPGPKLRFSKYCLETISPTIRNRLVTRYLRKSGKHLFVSSWLPNAEKAARNNLVRESISRSTADFTITPRILRPRKKNIPK